MSAPSVSVRWTASASIVVSFAAWCFLELVHQIQIGVFDDLPDPLGYDDGAPLWWSLPVLGLAGVVVAFAVVRCRAAAATCRPKA
jgi:hypothetical protein